MQDQSPQPHPQSRQTKRTQRRARIHEAWEAHYAELSSGDITLAEILGHTDEKLLKVADLGATLLKAGKYEKAQKILQGLPLLDPYVPYFHFLLGLLHEQVKDTDQALEEYDSTIELCTSIEPPGLFLPTAALAKLKLLTRVGRLDEAMEVGRWLLDPAFEPKDTAAEREAKAIVQFLETAAQRSEP